MEYIVAQYWPQLLAYTGIVIWLVRLEGRVTSNNVLMDRLEGMTCNLSEAINDLRETVGELKGMIKGRK